MIGLGVSMAAPVRLDTQTVAKDVLPRWQDVQPAKALHSALGLRDYARVRIGNDANLGAWAEFAYASRRNTRYGFEQPPRCLLYIKTAPGPSGIGSGVVFKDSRGEVSIFRGADMAGEIGHLPLDWPEDQPNEASRIEKCPHCKKQTCLQARTALPIFLPDGDHDTWDGVIEYLRPLEPAARYNTPEAKAVVNASARLGRTLGIAVTLLNPDLVVIAGPLSHVLADPTAVDAERDVILAPPNGERRLLAEMEKAATTDAFAALKTRYKHPAVFRTGLGWWGVAMGAAARAIDFKGEQVPFFRAVIDEKAAAEVT